MLERSHERALFERERGIDWRSTSGTINYAADGWERLFEDPIDLSDGISRHCRGKGVSPSKETAPA